MLAKLQPIIEIQDFDIKMIRLMRLKQQRHKELVQIEALRAELREQQEAKEGEIKELTQKITAIEEKITALSEKLKALEEKQSTIKKVDEFNAMTKEITDTEREKASLEQEASNIIDERTAEEEVLEKIKESLTSSETSSEDLENEIRSSIEKINAEGAELKKAREGKIQGVDSHLLAIYERLLRNKKDRVIVPVENRTCSGCHISLTLQQENLVRKGENIIFCEHCSRILYWHDEVQPAAEGETKTRRRRRVAK